MGTNYFLYETKTCPTCGRGEVPLHIGKSSAGWCFALHVLPGEDLLALESWKKRWSLPGVVIKSEYGEIIDPKEMLRVITERRGVQSDPFTREWLEWNHAEQGPYGLARSKIGMTTRCVGHGETWDLIENEFS